MISQKALSNTTGTIYTGSDVSQALKDPLRLSEAQALVDSTDWAGFDDFLVLACVADRVIGVIAVTETNEMLFVVAPQWRGCGVGTAMIEALVAQVDPNLPDVMSPDYEPRYVAVTGSLEGEALLRRAHMLLGWRVTGVICWPEYDQQRLTFGNLSPEAVAARIPPRPEELVGALNDQVHKDLGGSRAARAVRTTKG